MLCRLDPPATWDYIVSLSHSARPMWGNLLKCVMETDCFYCMPSVVFWFGRSFPTLTPPHSPHVLLGNILSAPPSVEARGWIYWELSDLVLFSVTPPFGVEWRSLTGDTKNAFSPVHVMQVSFLRAGRYDNLFCHDDISCIRYWYW